MLAKSAQLAGTIHVSDGQPLAGVQVQVSNLSLDGRSPYELAHDLDLTTDELGRFQTAEVPAGQAQLWVYKNGYCRPGLGLDISLPTREVKLTMVQAANIAIQVDFSATQRPTGYIVHMAPAEGAAVGRWSGSGHIDEGGAITFSNVPPGKYVVTGRPNPGSDDEETAPQTFDLKGGEDLQVALPAK